jgi:hypothetical protein
MTSNEGIDPEKRQKRRIRPMEPGKHRPKPPPPPAAAKLREWLGARGLTQQQFAAAIGEISNSGLSRILVGRSLPSLERVVPIQEATEGAVKPEDWLLPNKRYKHRKE